VLITAKNTNALIGLVSLCLLLSGGAAVRGPEEASAVLGGARGQ